jgi:hypothetical protein
MHPSRALLALTVALGGASLLACGSSAPETTSPSPAHSALPTLAGLPYHYQSVGQSSSPTFHVDKAGAYTVEYAVKGTAEQPGCTVSIVMVGPDGSEQQVVSNATLQPSDSQQKSVAVNLTAGDWRFQEGGGCSWNVTVSRAA